MLLIKFSIKFQRIPFFFISSSKTNTTDKNNKLEKFDLNMKKKKTNQK